MATEADIVTGWTKAEVVATALGSIGIVLTLFYSAWSFRTTLREGYYAELDRVYFELLKIGLERTYLRSSLPPADPARASEYEAYAFMVWNFLETVVATESAHRAWFDAPENRRKFKVRFCRFIEDRYPVGVLAQRTG